MKYRLIVSICGGKGYELTYHDFDLATAAYEREIRAGGAEVQLIQESFDATRVAA